MPRTAAGATGRRPSALASLVSALLIASALAGCGAPTTPAGAPGAGTPPALRATASPSPRASQMPMQPLSFPEQWRSAIGVGLVSGFGFGVSSSTGYACTMGSLPGAAQMPALELTHDGGASWSQVTNPPFTQDFGCSVFVDQHNAADVVVQAFVSNPVGSGTQVPVVWRSLDGGATWTRLPGLNGPAGLHGDARYLGANQQVLTTPDGAVIAAFWTSFEDVSNQNPSAGVVSLRRGDSTWQVFAPGGVSAWQLAGGPGAVRLSGLQAMSDEPFVSMAVP